MSDYYLPHYVNEICGKLVHTSKKRIYKIGLDQNKSDQNKNDEGYGVLTHILHRQTSSSRPDGVYVIHPLYESTTIEPLAPWLHKIDAAPWRIVQLRGPALLRCVAMRPHMFVAEQ